MTVTNHAEFHQRMGQVQDLVDQIEAHPDPSARALSRRLTQALLELHEVGLRRMLELISEADDALDVAAAVPPGLQNDPLVSNLLILHQLHPLDVETRIENALLHLQPLLDQHQVDLEVLELTDDQVHLQLSGGCGGCHSSELALRRAIDAAICGSAPELQVIITGGEAPALGGESQLPILNQGSFGS